MLKINSLVRAQPLFFHTNSVKCFSVFRVYLNIGFSVYMRHLEHYSKKTTRARVIKCSAVVPHIVMSAIGLF